MGITRIKKEDDNIEIKRYDRNVPERKQKDYNKLFAEFLDFIEFSLEKMRMDIG